MADKSIVIAAPIKTRSGYGARSRDIAKALIDSGKYDVKLVPIRWGNTPQTALNKNNIEDQKLLSRIIGGTLTFQPDIFIHITIPNEFQTVGKYNIGITAGIETTACRSEWVDGCNRMDLVLTSSEHSKKVFESLKFEKVDKETNRVIGHIVTTTPIDVLFEGVDQSIYNSGIDKTSDVYSTISSLPEKFCFLYTGAWLQGEFGHDRKDVGSLVHVFMDTFKKKKKCPALILKTNLANFSIVEKTEILKKIHDIKGMFRNGGWIGELPNVYLLHGNLSDDEMNVLYHHPKIKAMVSFTHGEGYGRPLLEFTTTGKPVIASGWSGQVDFLHPSYSVLLPGQLQGVHHSAQNDWIIKGSKWFVVNYQHASKVLMDVFNNYSEYLDRSKRQKKYTKEYFTLTLMKNKLLDILDNLDSYKPRAVPEQKTLNLPKLQPKQSKEPTKFKLPKLKKV